MNFINKSELSENFTTLPNNIVNDKELSFKAKGVLWYLLSKPIDWKVYIKEVAKNSKEGIDAVRSAVKELTNAGYIIRSQERVNGVIQEWQYFVYDTPTNAVNPPQPGLPELGKPELGNPTILNTDSTKKESTKYIYTSESGKEYSLEDIYTIFLEGFNGIVKSKYKGSEKVKSKLRARLLEGYTIKEIGDAILAASENKFLMGDNENSKRYLTPEYILRADKLDEWLNSKTKTKSSFFDNTVLK